MHPPPLDFYSKLGYEYFHLVAVVVIECTEDLWIPFQWCIRQAMNAQVLCHAPCQIIWMMWLLCMSMGHQRMLALVL
jgi:hypothetical protein